MSIAEVDGEKVEMVEVTIDHAIHSIFQGLGVLEEMKLSNEARHYLTHCKIDLAASRLMNLADDLRETV